MTDSQVRDAIRSYFAVVNVRLCATLAIVGLLLIVAERGAAGLVLVLAAFAIPLSMHLRRPSDEEIDQWLRSDVASVTARALDRLGLEAEELNSDPVVILGPILWQCPGVPGRELRWRKGKDGIVRFAVHRLTILFMADQYVNSYSCDFNFARNVALNEQDSQYQYDSIVGVSIGELSQSYTLANGEKLVSSQGFTISFTSGETISVVVSAQKLRDLTRGEIPSAGVESAVKTIRTLLRSRSRRTA